MLFITLIKIKKIQFISTLTLNIFAHERSLSEY